MPTRNPHQCLTRMVSMVTKPKRRQPGQAWTIDDFQIGQELGSGGFGKVHIAKEKTEGLICVLKFVDQERLVLTELDHMIKREIELQSRLRHPNILRLYHVFSMPVYVVMVLEDAAQGDLYTYVSDLPGGVMQNDEAAFYMYKITDAVQFCHQHRVIHRDIKPENVLLGMSFEPKLADFGLAVHKPVGSEKETSPIATLHYAARELVSGVPYDHRIDHWSLGVTLFELLTAKRPFEDDTLITPIRRNQDIFGEASLPPENPMEVRRRIIEVQYKFPRGFDPLAKQVVQGLLVKDPSLRTPLPDLLESSWMQAYYNPNFLEMQEGDDEGDEVACE